MPRVLLCLAPPVWWWPGQRVRWRVFVLVLVLVFAVWLIERGHDLTAVVGVVIALGAAAADVARRMTDTAGAAGPVPIAPTPPPISPTVGQVSGAENR